MNPIAIISGDFVKTGGMDRANYALADYLARANRELHLVAHRIAPELAQHKNVTFHRVPKPLNSYLLASPLLSRIGRRVARQIHARGGRVIVNGGNCPVADINWVHYVHAAYRPQNATSLPRQIKSRIERARFLADERRALSRARLIIVNSNRTKRDLIEHLNLPAQKIRTLYYGNDPTRFYPPLAQSRPADNSKIQNPKSKITGLPTGSPLVAFIGALGDRRKGFDTLFQSWRALTTTNSWDAHLAVIGSGAELPAWQARAREAKLINIHFLGFRDDVPDILRSCDAFVAPTRYEAYGLGVHEALCCGLPAIVSASSGIAERFPADLAKLLLLQNPDDPVELGTRLHNWRAGLDHFHRSVAPFAADLASYSWDDMSTAFMRTLNDIQPEPTAHSEDELSAEAVLS